jgi:hypothetical protein
LADRHYSRGKIGDKQFVGPGESLTLRDADGKVVFVWLKSKIRDDNQTGINCTIFRNESDRKSSEIILEAERFALSKWSLIRAFTYIDAKAIRSKNPGYCFKKAGWKVCGKSKSGKILLEKQLCH